ncbi:MAG: MmcQ/YjbR family DNA-binding protein [Eubacteriales bacterium]|nr:MmcQ/YjbR family DNA-binding protein [Eubacteriales bacterium]
MTRQELFTWVRQQYGTEPEYPWHDRNAVLRRKDNSKWYGVVLEVSGDKLGLTDAGTIDVLNVKCDPILVGSLRGQDGYFAAYHMNKEKWLSIRLGNAELDDSIKELLALSYELTASKAKIKAADRKS